MDQFNEKNIKCGTFLLHNSCETNNHRNVVFKISYVFMNRIKKFGLVNVFDDGFFYVATDSLSKLAECLNEDEEGYKKINLEDVINIAQNVLKDNQELEKKKKLKLAKQ